MKLRNKKTGKVYNVINESIKLSVGDRSAQHTGYYTSLTELNAEWEDYEESKKYWFINPCGEVVSFYEEDENPADTKASKAIGDYFNTREEAEQVVEKLKAWKRLKDKNFHFLKYSALGCGEIEFRLDFEDMDDEGEIGELRHDLDLLFGGEE